MTSNQPKWNLIANLGDVNPIDYGGYFVYSDETGAYAPEVELLISPDEDEDGTGWTVYRFAIDRLQTIEDSETHKLYLVSANYNASWPHAVSQYDEWFHRDLASVANFADMELSDLRSALCSADPIERASAYRAIGDYHGFENFDSYPLTFAKRSEVRKRYRNL